jgi:nicotinate-nucleotide adenylyltransferase
LKKVKKKIINIGILGGTFDPPHKGHLHISKVAIKKFHLNKLIWAVTKKNPLKKKKPYFDLKTRIGMSKKITYKENKIFIHYFDSKIKSNTTFKLVKYIKKKYPKSFLYFLIGADNLFKLHKWHKWKKITTLAKIVVFPRKNHPILPVPSIILKNLKKNDFIYINTKKINISSSLIRKFW